MITILWLLYLTALLFLSLLVIGTIIDTKQRWDKLEFIWVLVACLGWSIWYMYYLH